MVLLCKATFMKRYRSTLPLWGRSLRFTLDWHFISYTDRCTCYTSYLVSVYSSVLFVLFCDRFHRPIIFCTKRFKYSLLHYTRWIALRLSWTVRSSLQTSRHMLFAWFLRRQRRITLHLQWKTPHWKTFGDAFYATLPVYREYPFVFFSWFKMMLVVLGWVFFLLLAFPMIGLYRGKTVLLFAVTIEHLKNVILIGNRIVEALIY